MPALSPETESFLENGYFVAPSVFSADALEKMERDFDRIAEQLNASGEPVNARWDTPAMEGLDDGGSEVIHTHSVHRYSDVWLRALMDPSFLDWAEKFVGPNIILHHTKLFLKPPERGAPFPAHQDWSYFPMEQDSMIAGIIFLQDTDDSMGGLRVYPGSHKLGRLENSSGLAKSRELADYPIEDAVPVTVNRGDVVFFHYCTLHGSLPNRSDRIRKTVLVQLHSGEDSLEDNPDVEHHYDALTLRGWNYRMTRSRAKV
ncbi:MAG: phytanoyl-CoA dioxygenase family protein [Pseudomonadota bacterium]